MEADFQKHYLKKAFAFQVDRAWKAKTLNELWVLSNQ
jgi:hypothetical protein